MNDCTDNKHEPSWKDTGILGILILIEMSLCAILVGGFYTQVNSSAIFFVIVSIILVPIGIIIHFKRRKYEHEPQATVYNNLLFLILILLITVLIGGLFGTSTKLEMIGAFFVILLLFSLSFVFFVYYFDKIVKHPVVGKLEECTNKKLGELKKYITTLESSTQTLDSAARTIKPHALISQEMLIIGSADTEMMGIFFKEYTDYCATIKIDFIGTLYGAGVFPSQNADQNAETTNSYGFFEALKKHIISCREYGERNDCHTEPFNDLRFVCCQQPIYALSAKYLFLQIVNEMNDNAFTGLTINAVYPYDECITAILIASSNGKVSQKALISPSIGKKDKSFLSKHYPVGIIIKDVGVEITDIDKAETTLNRYTKHIDAIFKEQTNTNTNTKEKWTFSGNVLTISNLQPIDCTCNNNSGDNSNNKYYEIFCKVGTSDAKIEAKELADAIEFIGNCIQNKSEN